MMMPKAMAATVATEDRNSNGEGGLDSDSEGGWRQRRRKGVETMTARRAGTAMTTRWSRRRRQCRRRGGGKVVRQRLKFQVSRY